MKSAKTKYDLKYAKAHLKRIPLDVPVEMYASIKVLCDARGEPVNAYIKRLILADMQAAGCAPSISPDQQ